MVERTRCPLRPITAIVIIPNSIHPSFHFMRFIDLRRFAAADCH
jgi:hypothetical protein